MCNKKVEIYEDDEESSKDGGDSGTDKERCGGVVDNNK